MYCLFSLIPCSPTSLIRGMLCMQKEVHLEAFQCSNQAVKLWQEGWFCEVGEEVSGESHVRNPHDAEIKLPVMISGKDTDTVDNDFFLVPIAVRDHEGPFFSSFAVENRLTGQVRHCLSFLGDPMPCLETCGVPRSAAFV